MGYLGNFFNSGNNYTKTQAVPAQSIPYSASIVLDMSQRSNFTVASLTGNLTLSFSNPRPGASGCIVLVQDGTGNRILTLSGTNIKRSGGTTIVLSTGANAKDILTYYCEDANNIHVNLGMKDSK